ncbi:MAG: hypothetical protein K6F86_08715 [Lachnospiraceae bacterium]|nr:hypothetical protein [Lachnospiraceae bacterium]
MSMKMEKILRVLFDYQKYEREPELSSVIEETRKKNNKSRPGFLRLGDDDLNLVNAAGELIPRPDDKDDMNT